MMDFGGSWKNHLHLVDFSFNNSYWAITKMTIFENLYGRKCISPLCCDDVGETRLLRLELDSQTVDKVRVVEKHLKTAQDR